ncbi:EamA family transporter [Bacillus sp. Xin]|uniref:DMT family transporter n=1 Tax=unclassified Bacillus (in: firmicutes) TaxID=185979 RepID=UPI001574D20D|nr:MULTISPECIES: DMT family transporter [unclassified Bacillus (in: firmicutes)]MBC6973207.1 EamA family transporter [Bacillus sp. Xin]NSW36398.1 EamA family transporter [Bacillus sp. Xin1]
MKRWQMEWLLISVALVWGANYTIGKYGVAYMSSIQFNSLRFLVASPVLLLITFFMERSLHIEKKDWLRLLAVGIVGTTLYQTLFMLSVKYTSATNASLLIAMSPIFTGILAVLHKQERFSMKIQIGSLLSFSGAALVLLTGHTSQSTYEYAWLGNVIGLVAAIAWGWYPILAQPLITKYSAMRVTSWSTLIGIVPLVIYCLFNVNTLTWPADVLSWGSLGYSIVFATVFGLAMWYVGISKLGSTKVMVYMYLVPLFAVIVAAVTIGERMNMMQLVGGFVIFIGLYVVKKGAVKKPALNLKKVS